MTEVSYQPREKVIIHEYSCYDSIEALIKGAFAGAPPGANAMVKWVDGVVMVQNTYPMIETNVKELIEGRLHWDHVSFAPMEKYKPNLLLPEMGITVTIVDVSVNAVFRDIASFIKKNLMHK
jgi:hypothetical protein